MRRRWATLTPLLAICINSACSARLEDDYVESQWPSVKVVINSNMKYQVPLNILLDTMKAFRFENFTDVIIVVGGAAACLAYGRFQLSAFSSFGADVDRIYTDHDMTYIETPYMNYDLTGLAILGRYKDHPSVQANSYLYLLDTTTVGAGFLEKFKALSSMGYKEYRSVRRPASNICAFGRGLLEALPANFEPKLEKVEGLRFEYGFEPKGIKQFEDVADQVTVLRDRIEEGDPVDIYKTGYPRHVFW
ncbi:Hypothetical protein SCF082_LOCUS39113 [Durusdinium trenchii]|uniref:Uncharacterized protein n=1 Tax=Durusdinium trenchii TaxID=1381693 RepID=A0ABP0Q445_9DINO